MSCSLHRTMRELLAVYRDADAVFVDVPIGLPWRDCKSRPCDVAARRMLGRRASSVFPAPSRPACHAKDVAEARARNLAEVGRSLAAQTFAICPKVAEVDLLLSSDPSARSRIREVHPEVCFWALNGRRPMDDSKARPEGLNARKALLQVRLPGAADLIQRTLTNERRSDVQADDIVDAMVAFYTASAGPSAWRTVHGHPTHDEAGLPMEMVYAE